jgi:hypothetical protein
MRAGEVDSAWAGENPDQLHEKQVEAEAELLLAEYNQGESP